eukprot:g3815.t1
MWNLIFGSNTESSASGHPAVQYFDSQCRERCFQLRVALVDYTPSSIFEEDDVKPGALPLASSARLRPTTPSVYSQGDSIHALVSLIHCNDGGEGSEIYNNVTAQVETLDVHAHGNLTLNLRDPNDTNGQLSRGVLTRLKESTTSKLRTSLTNLQSIGSEQREKLITLASSPNERTFRFFSSKPHSILQHNQRQDEKNDKNCVPAGGRRGNHVIFERLIQFTLPSTEDFVLPPSCRTHLCKILYFLKFTIRMQLLTKNTKTLDPPITSLTGKINVPFSIANDSCSLEDNQSFQATSALYNGRGLYLQTEKTTQAQVQSESESVLRNSNLPQQPSSQSILQSSSAQSSTQSSQDSTLDSTLDGHLEQSRDQRNNNFMNVINFRDDEVAIGQFCLPKTSYFPGDTICGTLHIPANSTKYACMQIAIERIETLYRSDRDLSKLVTEDEEEEEEEEEIKQGRRLVSKVITSSDVKVLMNARSVAITLPIASCTPQSIELPFFSIEYYLTFCFVPLRSCEDSALNAADGKGSQALKKNVCRCSVPIDVKYPMGPLMGSPSMITTDRDREPLRVYKTEPNADNYHDLETTVRVVVLKSG